MHSATYVIHLLLETKEGKQGRRQRKKEGEVATVRSHKMLADISGYVLLLLLR